MSLLSHDELKELICRGVIENVASTDQVNSASIDIRLGPRLLIETQAGEWSEKSVIDKDSLEADEVILEEGHVYSLKPGEFVLGHSIELFNLPRNISAEYKLKSSMARLGLEHLNAGWCLSGDTKITLLNGTEQTIESLVGKTFLVYSIDNEGKIVPGLVSKVFETKKVTHLIEITLDNKQSFKCTPEHKVMLRDGSFLEADKLILGQSLMPLYKKINQERELVLVTEIKQITYLDPVSVYDLIVENHHNFALSCGIFVHNCDAGWHSSVLTLELKNITRFHTIQLEYGMRVGQVVFFEHKEVPEGMDYGSRGSYNNIPTVQGVLKLKSYPESIGEPEDACPDCGSVGKCKPGCPTNI